MRAFEGTLRRTFDSTRDLSIVLSNGTFFLRVLVGVENKV